jgi:hypothetical protein
MNTLVAKIARGGAQGDAIWCFSGVFAQLLRAAADEGAQAESIRASSAFEHVLDVLHRAFEVAPILL